MYLKKMTLKEFALFLCDNLNPKESFNFQDNDNEELATCYNCAAIMIAGHLAIIANRFGGGAPFCFDVSTAGDFVSEAFTERLRNYLSNANFGEYVWLECEPVSRIQSPKKATVVPLRLDEFAIMVWDHLDDRTFYSFTKWQNDSEVYQLRIANVANSEIVLCSSSAAGKTFWCELNDETLEESRHAFFKYLVAQEFKTVYLKS